MPIVAVPHPLAKCSAEECDALAQASIEEIVAALVGDATALEETYRAKQVESSNRMRYRSLFESDFNAPDAPDLIKAPESLDAINRVFYQRGWTDGLPVVPPTPERHEAMLGDRDPSELIGIVEPQLGQATVSKLAVNAVMAGCEPSFFGVVIAITRAMCNPSFNLKALQSTTHPCTVLSLVGGPVCDDIELNGMYNAMGQGQKANAAIGRAIRLILTNIGGAVPGVLDRSTMGSPAKYSFCFAENDAANPWEPFHVELGFDPNQSCVTVCGVEGPHNVNDHYGRTGEEILLTIAGTLASPGANNFYLEGQPIVVIGPEHAEVIAGDGFSKAQVREFLSERAIIPRVLVSDAMLEVMIERMPDHVLGPQGRDGIRFVTKPDDLIVLVAGGAGRHSAILPTFGHATRAVTEIVE
ncbi:MAG: hypothetical protein O7H39_07230 [Gammaproteobacteria bacterium]|nr:hypothetical protein [Gammaproteobacteria bacterium]